jgi:hypothetical protein
VKHRISRMHWMPRMHWIHRIHWMHRRPYVFHKITPSTVAFKWWLHGDIEWPSICIWTQSFTSFWMFEHTFLPARWRKSKPQENRGYPKRLELRIKPTLSREATPRCAFRADCKLPDRTRVIGYDLRSWSWNEERYRSKITWNRRTHLPLPHQRK